MNQGPPQISVVTPLYNKAQSVRRAIDSVLAQTFTDFEMLVIDDGSTDDSASVVADIDDPRVTLVRQHNQGAAAARNKGIALARATHIAFLDADDAWMPAFLATIVGLIDRFPDAGAYSTGYYIKNPGLDKVPARFDHVPRASEGGLIASYFRVAARGNNPVWSSAVCIPKSTFERVGGFPLGLRLYEDLHLWARIAIAYPMAYAAEPLAVYFRDAENRRGPVARQAGDLKFADAIHAAIENGTLAGDDARAAQQFVNHYRLLCAFKTLLADRHAVAREIARRTGVHNGSTRLRRYLVMGLSWLPHKLVTMVWHLGRISKRMMVNSAR